MIHRDYSNLGSRIIIRMFKDRIEFNSPGGLPEYVTPENIVYEQYSRNPLIAEAFEKIKYIEKMGEGWDKIIYNFKNSVYNVEMPEIIDTGTTVIVKIFSPKEMTDEGLTKVDERLTEDLSEKEKEIIKLVLKNKNISSSEVQKKFNISREMANRYFNNLIRKTLIKRISKGNKTYYVLEGK